MGRPTKLTDDLTLALCEAFEVRWSSVKDACAVIGDDVHLSPDAVEKIYYAHREAPGVQDKRVREKLLIYAQSSERK